MKNIQTIYLKLLHVTDTLTIGTQMNTGSCELIYLGESKLNDGYHMMKVTPINSDEAPMTLLKSDFSKSQSCKCEYEYEIGDETGLDFVIIDTSGGLSLVQKSMI